MKNKLSTNAGDIAIRAFSARNTRDEAEKQGADLALFDRLRERYGDKGLPPSQFFPESKTARRTGATKT